MFKIFFKDLRLELTNWNALWKTKFRKSTRPAPTITIWRVLIFYSSFLHTTSHNEESFYPMMISVHYFHAVFVAMNLLEMGLCVYPFIRQSVQIFYKYIKSPFMTPLTHVPCDLFVKTNNYNLSLRALF